MFFFVKAKLLHGHAVGELLKGLAVQRDGDAGVSVEGELHAVQHLGLCLLLRGRIRVIFVPVSNNDREYGDYYYLAKRR